jgi:hypothetical protein
MVEDDDSNDDSQQSDEEGGNGWRTDIYRWPKVNNQVIVPYKIDDDQNYSKKEVSNMKKAMAMVEAGTCVNFRRRKRQKNYLFITIRKEGCSSYIGMIGDEKKNRRKQPINFDHDCTRTKSIGSMAHEFVHALGFFHLQNHAQRDNFVEIFEDNIEDGKFKKNFKRLTKEKSSSFGTPYDYKSIMHYSPYAFAIDEESPTMVARINPEMNNRFMGQRNKLSPGDVVRINRMYECSDDDGGDDDESGQDPQDDESEGNSDDEIDSEDDDVEEDENSEKEPNDNSDESDDDDDDDDDD